MARKGMNAAVKLLIAVAIGLAAGFLLRANLPGGPMAILTEDFLTPLFDLWIRILSVMSGPVIFLMVCTSVLNTGTIEEEGGSSKRVVMRYFIFSFIVALIATLACIFILDEVFIVGSTLGIDAAGYWDAILRIVPSDIFSPLVSSNTPQILFLALVLGNGIVLIGSRANGLAGIIRQGNMVGLLMTELISRCVPYFVAVLLCMEILKNNMRTFWGMWGILLLALAVAIVIVLCVIAYVAKGRGVRFGVLFSKIWPTFLTSVRTGSLDESFGQVEFGLTRRLGIEKHYAIVSLPYGLILYMPMSVVGILSFTIFAAVQYHQDISVGWLIIAMALAVVLFVSTPPVPGANLLAYIMVFAQLGIPAPALVDAMIFDLLFGIFASAANQVLVQMDLILQAEHIGLLNKEVLRRPLKKG